MRIILTILFSLMAATAFAGSLTSSVTPGRQYYQWPTASGLKDSNRILVYDNLSGSRNITGARLKTFVTDAVQPQLATKAPITMIHGGVYDDFNRSDRVLNGDVTPSGQTWTVSGPGYNTASIVDGVFQSPYSVSSNCYASLPAGGPITRISGAFSFHPGAGANDASQSSAVLIADGNGAALTDMLHLIMAPSGYALTKRRGGGSFDSVAGSSPSSGVYPKLLTDGTVYRATMVISGQTLQVTLPTGEVLNFDDPDIAAIAANVGIWQIANSLDSYEARWHGVEINERDKAGDRALLGAAGQSDITWLKGKGITKKQRVTFTTPATAGWYRIATGAIIHTFAMSGQVTVTALDPYADQSLSFQVDKVWNAPAFRLVPAYSNQSTLISQVRVSSDTSTYAIGLDIYLAYDRATEITVDFDGYFVPVDRPVAGAQALTTYSTVINTGEYLPRNHVTVTTGVYAVSGYDAAITADYAGTVTLVLPDAAASSGREITLRTIQNQTVISAAANVVPLAGGAAGQAILSGSAGKFATLKSDGSVWQIIMGN